MTAGEHRPLRQKSAGLLIFRRARHDVEVLLVHPGGPFWARKDAGAWSIPKGELSAGEDPLGAAVREVEEETGHRLAGPFHALAPVRQRGGKTVLAWAVEAGIDAAAVRSNTFTVEWPPRSGRLREFPEIDRAAWFTLPEAQAKINSGQRPLLEQLRLLLGTDPARSG